MPREKEIRVSNLLDIEKDIVPYPINAIRAGVGSGKNGIIEGVHKEIVNADGSITKVNVKGLAEKYRVLIITSRKSKVTETEKTHEKDLCPYLTDVRHLDDFDFFEYEHSSLICTTAHIKTRIQKDWAPSELFVKPFWESFDFIVVDEFHSLVVDATFAESAFIMKCFIDMIYKDYIKDNPPEEVKPKLIFMSGTPDSTKALLNDFPYKKHDLLDKAKYIKPKNIEFTHYKAAIKEIKDKLKKKKSVVYYMCQLDNLDELIECAKSVGVTENEIAVSVSSEKTNKKLESNYPETIYKNKSYVEKYLSENQMIPEDIKFFITNSKNKEGINIENNPDLLVLEHHYEDDIIQICGRFRNRIKNVKIIYNVKQFTIPERYEREEEYQREYGVKATNEFFYKLVEETGFAISELTPYHNQILNTYIDFIEKSTPFLRYNPFEARFIINDCYIQAVENYKKSIRKFNEIIRNAKYGNVILDGYYRGINIMFNLEDDLEFWIERYFDQNGYVFGATVFNEKQGEKLLKVLNKIYIKQPDTSEKEFKSIGSLLKRFGCKKVPVGKHDKNKFKVVKL